MLFLICKAGRGYWHLQTRILLWLAKLLLLQGQAAEAQVQLETALKTARAQDRALWLIQTERLRARLLASRGDWPAAAALFAETVQHALELELPLEVARTQAAWGEAGLVYSPDRDRARELLDTACAALSAHDARGELQAIAARPAPSVMRSG